MVESWKSDPQLSAQRVPVIDFLLHNCAADVNIQVGNFFWLTFGNLCLYQLPTSCILGMMCQVIRASSYAF